MSNWNALIGAYRDFPNVSLSLKIATLAQWIKESGRGESQLALQHNNFAGLKYRARMRDHAAAVDYRGRDGELTTYCSFADVEAFLRGYWHFIDTGPYEGWEAHERDGAAFIRHLVAGGYCPEAGYAAHVLRLFDEARALLNGDSAAPPPSVDPVPLVLARLAVVVGHNRAAPGAMAVSPVSEHEFGFNSRVAALMAAEAAEYNLELKTFFREPAGGYGREIRNAYATVAAWRPDCVLELHFNAAGPDARGAEVLHAVGSRRSKALAAHVLEEVVAATGLRSRGLKAKERGERGAGSLFATEYPTIVPEPFFGSNKADCLAIASQGKEKLALAYLRGVRDWAISERPVPEDSLIEIVAAPVEPVNISLSTEPKIA